MIVDVVHAGWCIHFTFDADLEMKTSQPGWPLQGRERTALLKMSSNLTFKEEGDVYICCFCLGSKKMFVRWSNRESGVRTASHLISHLRSKSEFCLLLVLNSSYSFIMEKLSVIGLYRSGKYSATSTLPFGKILDTNRDAKPRAFRKRGKGGISM